MPAPVRVPHRGIHVASLALCAMFLPWSTAFLSISQMILAANWIAAGLLLGEARARWSSVLAAPAAVFISYLGLHAIGLLWTEDLGWGVDLCRILLPVLVFGVVLAGSERLKANELRTILLLGSWSAIASGLFGVAFSGAGPHDYRSVSMFISHIRLALLLCLSIAVLIHYADGPWLQRAVHAAGGIAALLLLWRLGSIQGAAILTLMAWAALWRRSASLAAGRRRRMRAAFILIPLGAGFVAAWAVQRHHHPVPSGLAQRMERTAGGELYYHDTTNTQTENGTHVWTYLAWEELRRTWPRRSDRTLDDLDDRGHPLWSTVVRYMASKGLRKDSAALMSLTEGDIRAIESGIPNARGETGGGLLARIEEVLFEVDLYRSTGLAAGHSVAMRLEFLRAGWRIAREHWFMGVGTGDTQRAFDAHYAAVDSPLGEQWRLRAHNQYLTLWISFGAFGLVAALLQWWWPAWRLGAWRSPLFTCWAIAFGVSCLTDDTLETQAGATFFALYYALFVFGAPRLSGAAAPAPAGG